MSTSGYSGTPLAKKIGIKPRHRVRLVHRPDGWRIPDLPEGCAIIGENDASQAADVTLAFYRSLGHLASEAPQLVDELPDQAMLWISWPRRAAGHHSDIGENDLRDHFLPLGVVDVKVAALGDDWSGLKFVRRKENRH
jgi:hypothetical protein